MRRRTLPDLFRTSEALGLGWTWRELDGAVASGEVIRLCHGWYAVVRPPDPMLQLEHWEQCRDDHLNALALALRRYPGHAGSHTSAAVIHDMLVSLAPQMSVDLTSIERFPCSRRQDGVQFHHSDSMENETRTVNGLLVTDPVRTVADYLRVRGLPTGLALLDDALRRKIVSLPDLRHTLEKQKRWPGRPKALAALQLADPMRESWGESYSFGKLHLLGVPMPLHQVDILDLDGRWVARVDGLWPHVGVVGEADGFSKYFLSSNGDSRAPEQVVRENVEAEVVRQRGIEALGLEVLRWSPSEVRDEGWAVAGRVNAAFATARPQEVGAYAVWRGEKRRLPFEVRTPSIDAERLRYRRARRRTG